MKRIEPGSPEIPVEPTLTSAKKRTRWDWVAISTIGLIIVGGIQGWILYRQEKLMDAQNRPWVGLYNVVHSAFDAGKKLVLAVNIKNSGDMPALDMEECAFSIGVRQPELTVAAIKSLMPKLKGCHVSGKVPLFPNSMIAMDVSRQASWMTQDFIDAIKNGEGYLVIIGRVTYDSSDHTHHQTTFCAYYERTADTFNNCIYGNEAD